MQRRHHTIHVGRILAQFGIRDEYVLRAYVEDDNPWLHIHTMADDEPWPGAPPTAGPVEALQQADRGQYVEGVEVVGDRSVQT